MIARNSEKGLKIRDGGVTVADVKGDNALDPTGTVLFATDPDRKAVDVLADPTYGKITGFKPTGHKTDWQLSIPQRRVDWGHANNPLQPTTASLGATNTATVAYDPVEASGKLSEPVKIDCPHFKNMVQDGKNVKLTLDALPGLTWSQSPWDLYQQVASHFIQSTEMEFFDAKGQPVQGELTVTSKESNHDVHFVWTFKDPPVSYKLRIYQQSGVIDLKVPEQIRPETVEIVEPRVK